MEQNQFSANRIHNVDESGLCVVQTRCPYVISVKGKRQVGALTSAERGSLITVVMCMSAAGNFVPPMLIFPRKKSCEQLKKGAPPGTIFRFHPSVWIQCHLFTDWFDHFVEFTQPSQNKPVPLILDGHYSHTRNLDVILKAREKHVTILCLPPKTTHKLQPLDKTVMSALKTYYSEEIRIFLRANQRPVTHFDMADLFGLYPVRRDVFTEDDYLAANQNETGHEGAQSQNVLREVVQDEQGLASCESNNLVLPEHIIKIPNLEKKLLSSSSSESTCTLSVHNSSDENDPDLSDENDQPANVSADANCLYCEGKFSEDCRGEVWVRCGICGCWAHAECGGADKKDFFICDFCNIVDPNFEADLSVTESEGSINGNDLQNIIKKTKKKRANVKLWKRNIDKQKRHSGAARVTNTGRQVRKKVLKNACCDTCRLKCKFMINEKLRQIILESFWSDNKSVNTKRKLIASHVDQVPVKSRRGRNDARQGKRQHTNKYFLERDGERVVVCKNFFLSTQQTVDTAIAKKRYGGMVSPDKRGKHVPINKISDDIRNSVRNHISQFPTYTSHYSRERTRRRYMGRHLNITRMYRLYLEYCEEEFITKESVAKEWLYHEIFNYEFNYAFKLPANDTCDLCDKFRLQLQEADSQDSRTKLQQQYDRHLNDASNRYKMKAEDKTRSRNSSSNDIDKNALPGKYELNNTNLNENLIPEAERRSRKKRRHIDETQWKKNSEKLKRQSGQEYFGKRKLEDKWDYHVTKKTQKSCKCNGKTGTKCKDILREERTKLFEKFWELSWSEKRVYITTLVEKNPVKRARNRKAEKRSIGHWLHDKSNIMTLITASREDFVNPRQAKINQEKENLKAFFDSLPKLESRYCRQSTSKYYLEPIWTPKLELYRHYKNEWCIKNNSRPMSSASFVNMMADQNIALFAPKKDECDKCVAYKTGNLSDQDYQEHRLKKEEARQEKDADKNGPDNCNVYTMDMQSVLLCPKSNVSLLYYKTKLIVHNFTIFNLKTKDGYC
nr:unnamed protein product [Callosobruchus chinensis]